MDTRQSLFESYLETEPAQTELLPWLDIRSLSRLRRTCRGIHGLFNHSEFLKTMLRERIVYFIIAEPNAIEVVKMVKAYPEILWVNIPRVVNRRGQLILNNKPLQLAFGAGDVELCELLEAEIISACGSEQAGKAEIHKQLSKKFGNNHDEEDQRIKGQFSDMLTRAIQSITNERFIDGVDADKKILLSPATNAAIAQFREELDALHSKIIQTGLHSRIRLLGLTYEAYFDATYQWDFNYHLCALFEDAVLAPVLFHMSEYDAQKFSQGLYYILRESDPEPFARSLSVRCNSVNYYDCLRGPSLDFALMGSCIDIIYAGPQRRYGAWSTASARTAISGIREYVERSEFALAGMVHRAIDPLCNTIGYK